MDKSQIVYLRLDQIKPYEHNPRRNENAIKDVATSIRKYGWQQPIVVDKNNVIVVGHTRFEAAKQLSMSEVPCLISNLSDKQNREYRLADNKTNESAGWDWDKLRDELYELDFSDFDFSFGGLAQDVNIDDLFSESEQTDKPEPEPEQIQCPHCKMWFEKP